MATLRVSVDNETEQWAQHAEIEIRFAKDFWCDRLPISFEHFSMSSFSGTVLKRVTNNDQLNPFLDIFVEPIRTFRHDYGRGFVQTFTLPHHRSVIVVRICTLMNTAKLNPRGYLHHIRTNTNTAGMKEADDIFIHYQEQARAGQLRFRRWPMRAVSDAYNQVSL